MRAIPTAARSLVVLAFAGSFCLAPLVAQTDSFAKNFNAFKGIAPGVDFYAANRSNVAPFEKPVKEAKARLETFLGPNVARGAVIICSSLEQKDSVNEARVLRMGYQWVLIELTPEATQQQMLARIKAQQGGELPAGLLERMKSPSPEMRAAGEARLVSSVVQRMAYAALTTTLAPEKLYRSSRADDVARSPLPDWMDVGLAWYAVGGQPFNLRQLKERLEESFPLEDVLTMPRPFVAPSSSGGEGGVFIMRGGQGAGGGAGAPGSGGGEGGRARGGGGMNLPKDVQDRMMFDGQSSSFFAYTIQKAGLDKVKEVVAAAREGKNPGDLLSREDVLGKDPEKLEEGWRAWVKELKVEGPPGGFRVIASPDRQQPAPPPGK